jgi:hypothetical protein
MNPTLRILFIAGCALLFGFVSNSILIGVGHWYELKLARSEYDLSDAFMIAVFVQALCVVAGGFVGNWLYRRWRNKKKSAGT